MHHTPDTPVAPVTPVTTESKPRTGQVDVTELQTQLIKLQNQVTQLQAAQKTPCTLTPTPTPNPSPNPVSKPEPKFFKRSGTLIAPSSDVILLSRQNDK
jgi:hypothetical protein